MQLTRGALALYAKILEYSKLERGAFPLRKTLAAKIGVCLRSIGYYLRELVKAGMLRIRRRARTSSLYEIVPKTPDPKQLCLSLCPSYPISENTSDKTLKRSRAPKPQMSDRVSGAVKRIRVRMWKAKNPWAYRQAVIGVESRLEKSPPPPPKPKIPEILPARPIAGGMHGLLDHLDSILGAAWRS